MCKLKNDKNNNEISNQFTNSHFINDEPYLNMYNDKL